MVRAETRPARGLCEVASVGQTDPSEIDAKDVRERSRDVVDGVAGQGNEGERRRAAGPNVKLHDAPVAAVSSAPIPLLLLRREVRARKRISVALTTEGAARHHPWVGGILANEFSIRRVEDTALLACHRACEARGHQP